VEHYWPSVPGGFWFLNAYAKLLEEIPKDRPVVWVEVGVFHGQSLAYLGVEVLNRNLPMTIHAVDNFAGWPGVAQGEELYESFLRNTKPIRDQMPYLAVNASTANPLGPGFSIHRLPSVDAARTFEDSSVDVVWLDADHTEAAVSADIAAWLPKVKPGGWLGGDDWAFSGVRKAVSQHFPKGYLLGEGERLGAPWPYWLVKVEA